ncbi:MAG: DMT family transporter [Halocynthiibacter sp.]
MVAAMAGFALEDTALKYAARDIPVTQVLLLFGAGGAVIFAAILRIKGHAFWSPHVTSRPMRVRVLFEISGRLFYVLALALAPLSSATAILQAAPLVVVAGAAIFFGEQVGWRRWAAIFIGFIGVLIVLQPTSDTFTFASIFAVLGMLGFAGRDLASRAAPLALSTAHLGFYGFLSIIVAAVLFGIWDGNWWADLSLNVSLAMGVAILFGVVAYGALMRAMRTGDVATVTPFRYSRLLFGVMLGTFYFGERLSLTMSVGCALIVLSGLYILWRSNRDKDKT